MSERPERPSPPGTRRKLGTSYKTWSDRFLLVAAAVVLAFFIWNTFVHGLTARENPLFLAWAEGLLLVLCAAVVFSLLAEARHAWQEGLERQEPPPSNGAPSVQERSFRSAGTAEALLRHCTRHLDKHFRRFYAFHRYQAPYVAYLYYAKKGSLSLLGIAWAKTGFLLLFLVGYTYMARGDFSEPLGWEKAILGAGCLLVLSGLLIRATVPYRKVWLRVVEENNRTCLTLSCRSRSRDRWFEALCESIETQAGVVSCSTQSR